MWPFNPKRKSLTHSWMAEVIATTARCRSAKANIHPDVLYERVWTEYCSRKPFDEFKDAQSAIEWTVRAFESQEAQHG